MEQERKSRTFYGRRQGRPLRKQATDLMENLLPSLTLLLELGEEKNSYAPFNPAEQFGNGNPVWLEIGFGGGEHLAYQAEHNPDVNIIGVEPFINGVASLLKHLDANGARNVRIHQADVRQVLPAMTKGSLERVFLLFPDPWHKTRHNKRRLLQVETLDHFARLLKPGGELRMATDDMGYLRWMLERAVPHPAFEWQASGPSDWDRRTPDWPQTRYEEKGVEKGRKPGYLRFLRKA